MPYQISSLAGPAREQALPGEATQPQKPEIPLDPSRGWTHRFQLPDKLPLLLRELPAGALLGGSCKSGGENTQKKVLSGRAARIAMQTAYGVAARALPTCLAVLGECLLEPFFQLLVRKELRRNQREQVNTVPNSISCGCMRLERGMRLSQKTALARVVPAAAAESTTPDASGEQARQTARLKGAGSARNVRLGRIPCPCTRAESSR